MMYYQRWYWCTGCGQWHDYQKRQLTHTSMWCEWSEPNEKNFDGTVDELSRFIIARRLRREDELAFEKRVEEEARK